MRRLAFSGLSAFALCRSLPALAAEVDPYLEYEVTKAGQPPQYFTDVRVAAASQVANHCEQNAYTNCTIKKIWFLGSIYIADMTYTTSSGATWSGSVNGYRYYACEVEPSLYVTFHGTYGPYPNRRLTPGEPGRVFCLYDVADPETETAHQADFGPGDCETRPAAGNPINIGLSNKYQEVEDIAATEGSPLQWSRFYNSGIVGPDKKQTVPATARLGSRWRGTYDRSLTVATTKEGERIRLLRHTGERLDFVETEGRYRSVADPRGQLSREGEGWIYRTAHGEREDYDADGRLASLGAGTSRQVNFRYDADALIEAVDRQGRKLAFTYDSAGRMATVSDGNGIAVTYGYSEAAESGNKADLVRATYADDTFHEYRYKEQGHGGGADAHALTAIYDETGERFATFTYDGDGRAVASEHVGGVGAVSLLREADGTIVVTGPTKATHRYRYADVRGVRRLVGVDQPGGAGCGAASASIAYDDNGMVLRRVDFDGRVTAYTHDADGNELERTEASGTSSARRIATEWHPTLRRPVRVTWPGREERYGYDAAGNLLDSAVWGAVDPAGPGAPLTLSRAWRMSYDAEGRLLHHEGPRSDSDGLATLARYTYRTADAANCASGPCDYRKGDLWKIENALGHEVEILAYDAAGRVRARKDEQGSYLDYSYTRRGWLKEVKQTRPDGSIAITALTHTPRGDIASITDPDGVTLSFEYDKAGRLVEVSNPSNHRLRFQLDAAGQRIKEEGYDSFSLQLQLTRTFDALGRVETETRDGAVSRYAYDELGRPTGVTDADGRRDSAGYDALGRLREAIQDVGGLGAVSKVTHDPLDQLMSVEDPKGLSTRYLTTGLGDLGSVDSPDAGISLDGHDATGLVVRREGAGGVGSFRVIRDALGRPVQVQYDGGMTATYTYDVADTACPAGQRHAVGRLASMSQGDSRTVYCYDAPGIITRKIQHWASTTVGVSYRYSLAGRVEEVAVDGGARTTYRYDRDGSVTAVSVTPPGTGEHMLIANVAYRPFDLIGSWRYSNGKELYANRDQSGRVVSWGGLDDALYTVAYTPGGEVATQVSRSHAFRFDHDGLGYMTSVKSYGSGEELRQFEYDLTGDRVAMTARGLRRPYLYDPRSHRLTTADGKSRSYDPAGNTIGIGSATLAYDASGRLASASEQGRVLVSYGHDAAGQRVMRTEAGEPAGLWLYDERGHWLADYDTTGRVIRQAVWMGDYLVGLIEGTKLYYVQPDHLGTPRAVVDPVRNITVWRLRPTDEPFGTAKPDEDPDGDGARFVFDLRFPGQRYDAATGLHYNYYRDYDPATGRYIQVDPIGLAGGINPFVYANGSPLKFIDPSGEVAWLAPMVPIAIGALSSAIGDAVVQGIGIYRSDGCKKFNWRQLGISALGGAVGGRFLPKASTLFGFRGVAGLGAAVNSVVYFANGSEYDATGFAWAAGSGLVGGATGGVFQRRFPYGIGGTAASSDMVRKSNAAADVRLNTGMSSLVRSGAAGLLPSLPKPSDVELQPCGCRE